MDFYSKARNSISLNEAIEFAQKAIAEDKTFTEAYWFLAARFNEQNRQDQQIANGNYCNQWYI